MAKNWTVAEATKEILAGNKEAIVDVGRRFPLAALAIAKAGENAADILGAMSFITVRKIESILKDGVTVTEDDEEGIEDPVAKAEEKKEKEEPKKRGRKAVEKKEEKPAKKEVADDDYESMSEVDLFKVCKAKGLKPAPKQDKQYYLDLLNPNEEADDDDWEEEEKPAKPAKKVSKKKAAEDDDDDWDI
jgi:hypothetical protein